MSRNKIHKTFLLALMLLVSVLLAGCQSKEYLPIYQMETHEDYSESLYIAGVQYGRDRNKGWGNKEDGKRINIKKVLDSNNAGSEI